MDRKDKNDKNVLISNEEDWSNQYDKVITWWTILDLFNNEHDELYSYHHVKYMLIIYF